LAQGGEIRALVESFTRRADRADDDASEASWRRACAWLQRAADAVDGGAERRVRIELTAEEGRAVAAYMDTLPTGSSLGYAWRRGLTYIDLTPDYCDLVSTSKTRGMDVSEAIGWAAPSGSPTPALLASALAKIDAHARGGRHRHDN
jgi:hypothetical protein